MRNYHPFLNHTLTDPALLRFHYGMAQVLHAIGGGELGQELYDKLELARVLPDNNLESALREQLRAAGLGGRPHLEPGKRTNVEAWRRNTASEGLADGPVP